MATLIRTIGSPLDNGSGPIEVNSPLRSPADPPSTSFYQNMFNGLNTEYFHPTGGYNFPGQSLYTASDYINVGMNSYTVGEGVGPFNPSFSSDKATAANQLFSLAIGGAGYGQGPFSRTRVNMGGIWENISRNDSRYTATSYQSFAPDLYSQYTAGSINGSQLFARAWPYMDRDTMNTSNFNFSAPPRVHFNFTGSGGGSISGTGISFGGLRGTWTGGSTRSFNFGF